MDQTIHNATLQDLNDAPVGSHLLDRQGDTATKRADGRWSYPGWSRVKAGSVVRSFSPVTLYRASEPTLPDLVLADESPRIEHAAYDSASKMATARVDLAVYQISTADRSLADAAKIARTYYRDAARSAAAYAQLASLLDGARKEEEDKQQQNILLEIRQEVIQEAGSDTSYEMMGPRMRRLVDVAVAAKLALHKAQEAAK